MMDKADWIVLRLVKKYMDDCPNKAVSSRDVVGSVVYLTNKYGTKRVFKCIDALKAEAVNG